MKLLKMILLIILSIETPAQAAIVSSVYADDMRKFTTFLPQEGVEIDSF